MSPILWPCLLRDILSLRLTAALLCVCILSLDNHVTALTTEAGTVIGQALARHPLLATLWCVHSPSPRAFATACHQRVQIMLQKCISCQLHDCHSG